MDENWKASDEVAMDKCAPGAGFQVLREGVSMVVIFKPDVAH